VPVTTTGPQGPPDPPGAQHDPGAEPGPAPAPRGGRVGAHVGRLDEIDVLAEARARDADCVQVFLCDPQDWRAAPLAGVDAPALGAALRAAGVSVYVHAPYVLNVASTNNRIRIPSRTLLQRTLTAAARIGAVGLVVHGGHVTARDDPAAGVENWRKTVERLEPPDPPVPLLVENTAGGDGAMARTLDQIERLWAALRPAAAARGLPVGVVVDTAHAFSAGLDLATLVADVRARTGRVDLVHANDSRDPAGSSRDRHADLGAGTIGADAVVTVAVQAAAQGADVVLETPGLHPGHTADIATIRAAIVAGRGGRDPAAGPGTGGAGW